MTTSTLFKDVCNYYDSYSPPSSFSDEFEPKKASKVKISSSNAPTRPISIRPKIDPNTDAKVIAKRKELMRYIPHQLHQTRSAPIKMKSLETTRSEPGNLNRFSEQLSSLEQFPILPFLSTSPEEVNSSLFQLDEEESEINQIPSGSY